MNLLAISIYEEKSLHIFEITSRQQTLTIAASPFKMSAINVASVVTVLLLLLGVASAQNATGDGIPYKENNGCMGRYLHAMRYGNTYYLVPLSQAVQCYQNMTIGKDMALQTVNSYDKLFDLAYTFYDIAKDAPDSNPLVNTLNWEICSGSEQGQVRERSGLCFPQLISTTIACQRPPVNVLKHVLFGGVHVWALRVGRRETQACRNPILL